MMSFLLGVNFLIKISDFYGNNFLLRNMYQILLSNNEGRCSVKSDYKIAVRLRNFHNERLRCL